MKTLRDKITARIEECERTGNIMDVSGLYTALAMIDEELESQAGSQSAKADAGKPDYTLVPPEILDAIEKVREYGNKKYGDRDNWKQVGADRYWQALIRHVRAAWKQWELADPESGLPHMYHIATNAAFLCAMLEGEK